MELVSVIVPNYNHAPYLKRRLDSIIGQTWKHFELIILDDCSTDHSKEIIEQYRDCGAVSHISYNSQNSGSTFRQWARGIELARGKYIWIAESDDFCDPVFLDELVPALEDNNRLALAFCQSVYVTDDDQIIHKTTTARLAATINGHEFLRTQLLGANVVANASMAVFRKNMVNSEEYQSMKYCGDWLFWANLCLAGDVYISGKYLNYYLRHNNNVASGATRKGYDFLEGNQVYHYIKTKISILEKDNKHALEERVKEYLTKRDSLIDEPVRQAVWESMMQLDPHIKSLIGRMTWQARINNYSIKLINWLS